MSINFGGAVNLTYQAGDWMAINEKRMALASKVTGKESPQEIAAIAQRDKQLTLAAEKAKINEEVGYAMIDAMDTRKRKQREQRQRMLNNGVIFG